MSRRLYRSEKERIFTGVCGGLAEHLDIDPTLIRLIFIICTLFYGMGLIIYLALAILLPRESAITADASQVMRDNARDLKERAQEFAHEVRESISGDGKMNPEENLREVDMEEEEKKDHHHHHSRGLAGVILIVMGLLFIGDNMGIFQWFNFHTLWPLILIIVGAYMILRRSGS